MLVIITCHVITSTFVFGQLRETVPAEGNCDFKLDQPFSPFQSLNHTLIRARQINAFEEESRDKSLAFSRRGETRLEHVN